MFTVTAVLSALLALGFAAAGLRKVLALPSVEAESRHLGFSMGALRIVGLLELAGAAGLVVGLWLWPLGVAAAAALLALLVGAVRAHLRVKDDPKSLLPAAVFGAMALAVIVLRLATA